MLNIIHRGDQYFIPVYIIRNSEPVTPENSVDVRVKIGNYMQTFSGETLSYDTENRIWLFYLSEEMSRSMNGEELFQVGVKYSGGSEFIYSQPSVVKIGSNIIGERWGLT